MMISKYFNTEMINRCYIENKMAVEVSLINDKNVYGIVKTEKLENGNSNEEGKTMKNGVKNIHYVLLRDLLHYISIAYLRR